MLKMGNHSVFIVCLLAILLLERETSGQTYFKNGAPHVKLASGGILAGKVDSSREGRPYNAFIGIQYATIAERFAEAKSTAEDTWEGAKSVVAPGNVCPQSPNPLLDPSSTVGELDCLNLNVYVPMNNTGKQGYPVMMWVHGGGFMSGDGYSYGPQFFMDEDVILVTINYRLGVLGFLSTGDSVVPGNNGLKDMVLALQWINKNVRAFGGNPGKVTVFGESAGGMAVNYLLLSPTTKGLVHRVISQSGTVFHERTPDKREIAVELATYLKCPTTATQPSEISSEEIITCLRAASIEDLLQAQVFFKASWPMNMASFFFGAAKEPESANPSSVTPFLTEYAYEILVDRKRPLPEIPFMVGMTEDEVSPMFLRIITQNEHLLKELDSNWTTIAPSAFMYGSVTAEEEHVIVADKLRQFYFGTEPISAESKEGIWNIYLDQFMAYGVYKAAVETAARGKSNPTYLFQFGYHGPTSFLCTLMPCPEEEKKKVAHTDELPYLFDLSKLSPDFYKFDQHDSELSKHFVKLWTSFAIHGEPKFTWGNSVARKWHAVSGKEVQRAVPLRWYKIDSNPGQIEDPHNGRMSFWDQLHKYHFEKSLTSTPKDSRTEL